MAQALINAWHQVNLATLPAFSNDEKEDKNDEKTLFGKYKIMNKMKLLSLTNRRHFLSESAADPKKTS